MPPASDVRPTATYVYCVVKSARAPKLGRTPKGLAGAGKARLLDAGDGFHLVVTSAPLALYDAAAIDAHLRDLEWVGGRANEHEAVVEHATKLGAVVPMKLFTLFSSDDRAIAHVTKMKRSLDRVVERIAGCEEWGLRILFDGTRQPKTPLAVGRQGISGTSFLQRKKVLDDERRRAGVRGAAAVEELYSRLEKKVKRARRRAAPNRELAARVVLDASFLVPRASVKAVKGMVADAAKGLVDEGFDLSLTGPWPAYSFIEGR